MKDINKAGMLSFKLSIHDVSAGGAIDFREYNAWSQQPDKRAIPVKIRAYIYQCKDLPAADSNGTSDPYLKIWDMSENEKQTKVIDDNTNPLFFEVVELEYEVRKMNDLSGYPPFIIDLYDRDYGLLETDDYLGRAVIQP